MLKKVERTLEETLIHRRPFEMRGGEWPFVVIGPAEDGAAVIRTGKAEQSRIQHTPVYIATLGGPHIPEADGIPIEELADGDVPKELEGLKIFQLSPMRPLVVSARRKSPSVQQALEETLELHQGSDSAIIETPDESFWALSVLKYLDESDRFFPDPVVADFYARLGQAAAHHHIH